MTQLNVRDLMTDEPFTVGRHADLAQVYDLMDSHNVRHIPVVDDANTLLGVVSHRDLVRGALFSEQDVTVSAQRTMLRALDVESVMTSEPETVGIDDDIRTAGSMMTENKFGCLLVVDGEMLVGILTESDFVRYVVDNV